MNTGARTDDAVRRRRRARLVAAALSAGAAVCAIVGSALPLFTATIFAGERNIDLTMTSWGMEVSGGVSFVDIPANGYPLVFAAIVLVCGAVGCRSAARPGASPRTQRVAGQAVVAGGAFLACAVWMVALQVDNWADAYGPADVGDGPLRMNAETSQLAGIWVLAVAALLGVVAAVPALVPGDRPVPALAPVVDPEAPTPPFGIALPAQVDPLTGEPMGPALPDGPADQEQPAGAPEPIVIPDALVAPPPLPLPPGPAVPAVEDPLAEPRGD
jgi:hypothetical protein